jgi:hypothetical protein
MIEGQTSVSKRIRTESKSGVSSRHVFQRFNCAFHTPYMHSNACVRAVRQTTFRFTNMWLLHLRVPKGLQDIQQQLAAAQERTGMVG